MNAWPTPPAEPGFRRSRKVALVLLGAAGVVGAAAIIDSVRKLPGGPVAAPQPAPPPLDPAQTYANNDFIPGVGYYHAPYHAWYPFPYNYHDPARGYFAGGLWAAAPFALALMRSQPSNEGIAAALSRQRAFQQQQQPPPPSQTSGSTGFFSSGFRSSSGSFGGNSYSRSTPTSTSGSGAKSSPATSGGSHSSITHGGFGSSAHGSSGIS